MEFAARVERQTTFRNRFGGQGNIAGDHQIAGFDPFDDLVVGDIEAGSNLQKVDVARRWRMHGPVRHKRDLYAGTLGRLEQDIFDRDGTCIRIHPDFHFEFVLCALFKI
jgi:hypothetical protein